MENLSTPTEIERLTRLDINSPLDNGSNGHFYSLPRGYEADVLLPKRPILDSVLSENENLMKFNSCESCGNSAFENSNSDGEFGFVRDPSISPVEGVSHLGLGGGIDPELQK